jgi:hypothetical protein
MVERAYSDLKELLHSRRYKEMSSALAVSSLIHDLVKLMSRS